jgi:hypothetical protein
MDVSARQGRRDCCQGSDHAGHEAPYLRQTAYTVPD